MALEDSIEYIKRQFLNKATEYVSKPIRKGGLWILQVTDPNDGHIDETPPAKYNLIRRERARLIAWTALQFFGYDENEIKNALTMERIFTLGKACDMLSVGLRALGHGE